MRAVDSGRASDLDAGSGRHAASPTTVAIPYGWFHPSQRAGGVVTSLVRTVDTASDDVRIRVITRDRDLGVAQQPHPGLSGATVTRGRHHVTYLDATSPLLPLRVIAQLRREHAEILYLNSVFSVPFAIAPLLAVAVRVLRPRVLLIAPQGSFSQGALRIHGWRKAAYLRFLRVLGLAEGAVFHASTELEADDIRRQFSAATVVVCENQVETLHELDPPVASGGTLRLVFVSRISPKKNLLGALEALRTVSSPVTFDIYGPLEDLGYWAKCRSVIDRLGDQVTVTYRGELPGSEVVGTFGRYDAFLFPTQGENFGHVIAESLAASCYVITSPHSPWAGWLGEGGFVAHDPGGLAAEVDRIANLSPEARYELRLRARDAYRAWIGRRRDENVLSLVRGALLKTQQIDASPAVEPQEA